MLLLRDVLRYATGGVWTQWLLLTSFMFTSCAALPLDKWDKMEAVSRACLHLHCCDHKGRVMTKVQDMETNMSTSLITSQDWIVGILAKHTARCRFDRLVATFELLLTGALMSLCNDIAWFKEEIILRIRNNTQYGSLFHCVSLTKSQKC